MSIILAETFGTYTAGYSFPTSASAPAWVTSVGVEQSEVVVFNTMTGSTPAPDFYERSGQGYQIGGGDIEYFTGLGGTAKACTVMWAEWNNASYPILTVGYGTNSSIFELAKVLVEPDASVSIYINGTYGQAFAGDFRVANSGVESRHLYAWEELQFNCVFGTFTPGGTDTNTYVQLSTGEVWCNGQLICQCINQTMRTAIPGDGTSAPQPFATGWIWGQSAFLGVATYIGEVFISNGIYRGWGTNTAVSTGPYFPYAAYNGSGVGTMSAFVTQGVAEIPWLPSSAVRAARMTQGVAEIPWIPSTSTRNARFTQGVVEIIKRSGGGWVIYEA